ncbi:uncharacterized protein LOC130949027 [Arachis stenosperma]|uniref:uncharacterized protein LOC130949027 n=1 Tax=Arachis stenosperma TaxID=217475 RepID=UPI0025AD7DBE|nr:uncharacterized protein LOC130949027 [Arachis stenosperma]
MLHAKQGELSITAYFTKLRSLWEELESFQPVPACECTPKCSCGLGVIRAYRSEGCVVKFLQGLNDQFSTICSQVMMMEPLPNLNSTFALLTQQERQLGFHGEKSQILLNIAQPKSPQGTTSNKGSDSTKSDIIVANRQGRRKNRTYGGKGSGRGKFVCTYCGKLGHTIDVCYRKHGLPPHLKQRYNSGGAATFNYAATDEHADEDSADQKQRRSDEQCLEFTQDQKITLLALLQRNELQSIHSTNQIVGQTPAMRGNNNRVIQLLHFKSHVLAERSGDETKKSKSWIIDTGATDHVSYYRQDFDTYHHISTIIIRLPNGSYTTSNIIGTDSSKTRIGLARAAEGLSALDISTQHEFSSASLMNSVISFNAADFTYIWHTRLGHILEDKLANLNHTNNSHRSEDLFNYSHHLSPNYQHITHISVPPVDNYTHFGTDSIDPPENAPQLGLEINDSNFSISSHNINHASPSASSSNTQTNDNYHTSSSASSSNIQDNANVTVDTSSPVLRRSTQTRHAPAYLAYYHCINLVVAPATHLRYPLYVPLFNLSDSFKHLSLAIANTPEPKHYRDTNQTWKLTSLPARKFPIGCKWVFRNKFHSDGTIERYKARLVAKGFTQVARVDYLDTFNPVVKMTTLRVVLSLVAAKDWFLK